GWVESTSLEGPVMNVVLPADLEQFVNHLVESGLFLSPDDAIVHGLYLLQDQYELSKVKLEKLRKDIAVGVEQADRGEVAPLDMQALLARSRQILAQNQGNTHAPSPANRPG